MIELKTVNGNTYIYATMADRNSRKDKLEEETPPDGVNWCYLFLLLFQRQRRRLLLCCFAPGLLHQLVTHCFRVLASSLPRTTLQLWPGIPGIRIERPALYISLDEIESNMIGVGSESVVAAAMMASWTAETDTRSRPRLFKCSYSSIQSFVFPFHG